MIVVKAGDNVTLSCEIYGYLQSSFDIMWKENNVGIDNADPAYTTTIMQSDKLIQDGGLSPGPSIISQLNFITANMSQEQQTYSCVWREQALFFFVTTTDIITTGIVTTDIITTGECYLYLSWAISMEVFQRI